MGAPSYFYSLVSRVAAVVLLCAGGLKAQEFLSSPGVHPQWAVLGQTAGELLFGFWLLVGLYPRWSRILALVCFVVFLNVALAAAVQGKSSCGCFGKVSVQPWSTVGLDALLLVGLLFSPTNPLQESTPRRLRIRWLTFFVSAFLVLLAVGWPVVGNISPTEEKHIPTTVSDEMPSGIDASALERAIQGVEQNHAGLPMLVYTTETEGSEYPVKHTGTRTMREGNKTIQVTGTWFQPEKEKHSRDVWKTWIRGDEVRQEGLSHYERGSGKEILVSSGEILLISKGKRIQTAPEIQQAWISTSEFADEGLVNSIDLRCAGFQPPLRNIGDWLKNRCEVRNAGLARDRSGREVVRIRARVKGHAKNESEVTADFVSAMNFMPSRIVYYFLPYGGVATVTDIEYQQVGVNGAWFPRRIVQRCFPGNTTSDPDAPTGHNLSSDSTVKVLAFGQGVRDEDFDPLIPANTILLGDLPTQRITGDAPVRASQLTRGEPLKLTEGATPPRKGITPPASFWSIAAGMDVVLLGFCWMFRKRLAF